MRYQKVKVANVASVEKLAIKRSLFHSLKNHDDHREIEARDSLTKDSQER